MKTAPNASGANRNFKQVTRSTSERPKVGMISLGCAKNLVDAEIMLGNVLQHGMEIVTSPAEADVLVINTCAFIDSAKEESIEAILEAHQQRVANRRMTQKLIVSGCMSQRFAKELRDEMPEVDAFIGLDQVAQLGAVIEDVLRKRSTFNVQLRIQKIQRSMLGVRRSGLLLRRTMPILPLQTRDQPTYPITTHRTSGLLRRTRPM